MTTQIEDVLKKNSDPKARGKHFICTYNNWNTKLHE